jgi:hypothetical protein
LSFARKGDQFGVIMEDERRRRACTTASTLSLRRQARPAREKLENVLPIIHVGMTYAAWALKYGGKIKFFIMTLGAKTH